VRARRHLDDDFSHWHDVPLSVSRSLGSPDGSSELLYYTALMAMGKRKRDRQPAMWVTTTDLATAASHPFYRRLNPLLTERGCDRFA
jgi:hypothetical protein